MSCLKRFLSPYQGMPKEIYYIFVARIINALGCFVMPLLTIIMTRNIGLTSQMAGLWLSLSGLINLPAALLGGKLADTLGRKKVIVGFGGIAAVLYLIASFMPPTLAMIYVLVCAGACMVTAGPAHDALIADLTTPETRSGAYALSYMGWNLGFSVGPVLGGLLYRSYLPLVFIGDALTIMIALCLISFMVPETIMRTKVKSNSENRKLEQRTEGSVFSVLRKRPILIYFGLIMLGYNFAYAQFSFLFPMQIMQNFAELGSVYYGYLGGFNGLVVILFTPLAVRILENVNSIRRAVYGGLLYALGFGMLGVIHTIAYCFLWTFTFTMGEIILAISVTPFIVNHTPVSHRGRMNSFMPLVYGLGNTLGPLGMGYMLKFMSLDMGWRLMGISTLGFSLLMLVLEKFTGQESVSTKQAKVTS